MQKIILFLVAALGCCWVDHNLQAQEWNFGMITEYGTGEASIGLGLGYQPLEYVGIKAESLLGIHSGHQAFSANRLALQHAYAINELVAPYISYGMGHRNYFGRELFLSTGIRLTGSTLYYEGEVTRNCLERNYGESGCFYLYRPLVIGFRF